MKITDRSPDTIKIEISVAEIQVLNLALDRLWREHVNFDLLEDEESRTASGMRSLLKREREQMNSCSVPQFRDFLPRPGTPGRGSG